jgi:hypothetical protein
VAPVAYFARSASVVASKELCPADGVYGILARKEPAVCALFLNVLGSGACHSPGVSVREINAVSTIPVPNSVRVEMIYTLNSERVQNVYRVTNGSPATLANLQALWTLFRDWENVTAKGWRNGFASLVLISLTAEDGPGAPFYEAAVSPAIQGTQPLFAIPSLLTVCIKHITGMQGRSFRGRSYWVGLANSVPGNYNEITTSYANALAGVYTTLRTNLASAGWTFSVASLYSGVENLPGRKRAIPRAAGILTPIIASSCEIFIDTNRHRKPRTSV